ncbi:MAG TPA: zinc-ribbon domain-containing protein [Pyrinomonadaceae bacterium]|nr:zinc-ribbon domain-containing protein [Pyrinomonadaceae bacterium]
MSEPEIARRCVSCGASARQHAMFCPQCGNPLQQVEPAEEKTPAEEGVRSRVETLRVVIDQAAYDPSLRFILVAALLFVVFLVLLILSKVLG